MACKDVGLKPCPFCGGEVELCHGTVIEGEPKYFDVSCKDIHCRGFTWVCHKTTEEKAIEAWNTRTPKEREKK